MKLKEFIKLVYSLGGNMETELWIYDNDGYNLSFDNTEIEKDEDNSINIHTGIY